MDPNSEARDRECSTPAGPAAGHAAADSTPRDDEPISDLDYGLYAASLDAEDLAVGRALRNRRRAGGS